jgi:hypothetical protein
MFASSPGVGLRKAVCAVKRIVAQNRAIHAMTAHTLRLWRFLIATIENGPSKWN